jgi:hypothetical protein
MNVIVDTTSPVSPTISLQSVDSGIAGDNITNSKVISLTGVAEVNSTVTVCDGQMVLGSVVASAEGVWNLLLDMTNDQMSAPSGSGLGSASRDAASGNQAQSWGFTTAPLSDGVHTFSVTSTDSAGNVSAVSKLSVTIDTIAPGAPVITGNVVSNTNQVQLTGTAEAGATVKMFDGSTPIGTATANASGAWTFTTGFSDGFHVYTATTSDVAGNVSGSSTATSISASAATDVVTVDASALPENIVLTLSGSAAETVTGLVGNINAGTLTGALSVTTGDAADNGIAITTGSAATSITDNFSSDTVTINATAFSDDAGLSLFGSANFTATGLKKNLDASSVSGTLNVTTAAAVSGLSIATSSGANTITASALTLGQALTLTGNGAATVTLNAGNLAAGSYAGNLTVTGGTGANTITVGNGTNIITGGGGADILTGGTSCDTFNFKSAANLGAASSIAGGAGNDAIALTAGAT